MGDGAALSVSQSGVIPVRNGLPMMAAVLPSRGDTHRVLGPPPVTQTLDLWAATLFLVHIFWRKHFFLTSIYLFVLVILIAKFSHKMTIQVYNTKYIQTGITICLCMVSICQTFSYCVVQNCASHLPIYDSLWDFIYVN